MNARWKIHDIIDLEYYLKTDQAAIDAEKESDIAARDRRVYLEDIEPKLTPTSPFPRRFVIRSWLSSRRSLTKNGDFTVSPGQAYRSS